MTHDTDELQRHHDITMCRAKANVRDACMTRVAEMAADYGPASVEARTLRTVLDALRSIDLETL